MNHKLIENTIYGVAVGDALGMPHQFLPRQRFDKQPVTEMTGYGAFNYPAGTWSDDTSLTLALLDSLSQGLNYTQIMQAFANWYQSGKYTPTGIAFDIGTGTAEAIKAFLAGTPALAAGSSEVTNNGNGALMRLAPVVLYLAKRGATLGLAKQFEILHNTTRLTHGHARALIASGLLGMAMLTIQRHPEWPLRRALTTGFQVARDYYQNQPAFRSELINFKPLFHLEQLINTNRDNIPSSGYVVDTLIAVSWCLLTEPNPNACLLKAVNLGEDTDTIAAITGGVLGLNPATHFNRQWLSQLKDRAQIDDYIHQAAESASFS